MQFHVANSTDLPLTLNAVFTSIGGQQNGISRKILIPPKKWHPIVTSVQITQVELLKWEQDRISFPISVTVRYEDALERVRDQPFNGSIMCSKKSGVIFVPPYRGGLYIADTEDNDKKKA